MKICGIYSITNTINKKTYVGSSCDIKRRWRHHKQHLTKNIHHCIHLQRAWNKYGEKNFVFDIVKRCEKDDLLIIEQSILDKAKKNQSRYYNSSYHAGGQEPKIITNKQKQDIKKYWLKNNTAKTFIYAKNKYGFGMLIIQYLLMDIRKEIKDRPECTHTINPTIYTFYHKSGKIFTGRQYDLRQKYNINHSNLSSLISGKYKTTNGWSLTPQAHKPNT